MSAFSNNWFKDNATEIVALGVVATPYVTKLLKESKVIPADTPNIPFKLDWEQWDKIAILIIILGLRK